MKTTFIRALAIAILTSSMSAFAVTDNKSTEAASPCASAKQDDSAKSTKQSKKEKKNQKQNKEEKDNGQFSGIWG